MLPKMSDIMAMLRNAVAEFGGDTEIRKIPLNLDTASEDSSSYFSTKLNHVYKGLPSTTLLIRDGEVVAAVVERRDKSVADVQLKSLRQLYGRRKRIIAETGQYPGAGTELLKNNPNDAIDTEIE